MSDSSTFVFFVLFGSSNQRQFSGPSTYAKQMFSGRSLYAPQYFL